MLKEYRQSKYAGTLYMRKKKWDCWILLAFPNGSLSWNTPAAWSLRLSFVAEAPHIFGMVILLKNQHHPYLTVLLLCLNPLCRVYCPCVFKLAVFLKSTHAFPLILCKFCANSYFSTCQSFLICKTNIGEQSRIFIT